MRSSAIPSEGRLLKVVRARQEKREALELAQKITRELDVPLPVVLKAMAKLQPSPGELRGIPCVARLVPGAVKNSRPGSDGHLDQLDRARGQRPA